MKHLENYGVQELNAREITRSINIHITLKTCRII